MEILIVGLMGYLLYQYSNSTLSSKYSPLSLFQINQNNEIKLAQVNSRLAAKIRQIIALANQEGYLLYIDEAYRTQAVQQEYYARGRTTPGDIITNTLNSKHTQGKAVDLMPVINGIPTNNLAAFDWQLIGKWARQVGGLTWGGNWKSLKDYRHLELP